MVSGPQRTVVKPFSVSGIGLHEGKAVNAVIKPGAEGTGFVFVRTDLPGRPDVALKAANLADGVRRTVIRKGAAEVHTPEHLIAGLFGSGVDNAVIELDAQEPPAADGSAKAFADGVRKAGLKEQGQPRKVLKVKASLGVSDHNASITVHPHTCAHFDYTLDYGVPYLPVSRVELEWTPERFSAEVAPARTFCLASEAAALRSAGLGKGANTHNTLVIGQDGVIENELRWKDEFARHKMLDMIGDLALAGCRVEGRIVAVRSGHGLNQKLAMELEKELDRPKTDSPSAAKPYYLDTQGIMGRLPHRYPFLLVDRVLEIGPEWTYAVGIKNVTATEPYFQGHFPGMPVMPGVLQLEAMAQLSGILTTDMLEHRGKIGFLAAIEEAKFRRTVIPGDQLRIEAKLVRLRRNFAETACRCLVDGEISSEATIKFMMMPKEGGK